MAQRSHMYMHSGQRVSRRCTKRSLVCRRAAAAGYVSVDLCLSLSVLSTVLLLDFLARWFVEEEIASDCVH